MAAIRLERCPSRSLARGKACFDRHLARPPCMRYTKSKAQSPVESHLLVRRRKAAPMGGGGFASQGLSIELWRLPMDKPCEADNQSEADQPVAEVLPKEVSVKLSAEPRPDLSTSSSCLVGLEKFSADMFED